MAWVCMADWRRNPSCEEQGTGRSMPSNVRVEYRITKPEDLNFELLLSTRYLLGMFF